MQVYLSFDKIFCRKQISTGNAGKLMSGEGVNLGLEGAIHSLAP